MVDTKAEMVRNVLAKNIDIDNSGREEALSCSSVSLAKRGLQKDRFGMDYTLKESHAMESYKRDG